MIRTALVVGLILLAGPVRAHPHVFIDGGFDLIFDEDGRLDHLRVTWIYDPLTSLFILEDLGISPDAAESMGPDDRDRLAAYQTRWEPGFDGDGYLWNGTRRIALSGPVDASAGVEDGKVVIRFLRKVAEPFRPRPDPDGVSATILKAYDPSYYTAYALTTPPKLEGGAGACRTRIIRFEPDGPLAALLESLSAIPADGDPDGEPGALLADKLVITCD